ncbi:hypothetical protein QZH56_34605 [Streptomyces olivoreticuli]|uniref:hypothetical protein n=1 Tax=Streptomyces olivoreticuli TaxID=68246 RepID=UPI002659F8F9|nr:hypothetical protein [Streptomyces olivoreticuli]WKK23767.1 hypothetical protein QZH56_34605 [Streptomyces olivoreticuli]
MTGARSRHLTLDNLERITGGSDLRDSIGAHLDLSGVRVRAAPGNQQTSSGPIARAGRGG